VSTVLARIAHNLRRPLPELMGYLAAKLVSPIWASYLGGVGRGFHVCGGARIKGGRAIRIGDRFYAGPSMWLEAVHRYQGHDYAPVITIGSDVTFSDFVHVAATTAVTVHDGVLLGSRVHITDHAHGVYSGPQQDGPDTPPVFRRLSAGQPVVIGANVWLGDGVVVLPGVTIGEGCIVGANSVVSRSLPPRVMAVGAPALPIKAYDSQLRCWTPIAAARS
jgi:lipopolysaccharide O-acetyltransferase